MQTILSMKVGPFQGFITISCCEQKQTTVKDAPAGRKTLQLSLTCLTPLIANCWLLHCQINNIKTAHVCLSALWTHRHFPVQGVSFACCHHNTGSCACSGMNTCASMHTHIQTNSFHPQRRDIKNFF